MCEALRELFADDLRESREAGIMEGRTAGKIEGRIEGKLEGKIELIIKKYKKGCTAEETADMLEEPPSQIRQIYDAKKRKIGIFHLRETRLPAYRP